MRSAGALAGRRPPPLRWARPAVRPSWQPGRADPLPRLPARRERPLTRTRRLGLAALALLALAALALAALPRLAERAALAALRARGLPDARLEIAALGLFGAEVRGLALPPALEVGNIALDYSLAGLLDRRVDRLVVSDAALQVVFTQAGPSLGRLDALVAGAGGDGAQGGGWSLGSLELRGLRLALRQGAEPAGSAEIELLLPGPLSGDLAPAQLLERASARARLELALARFDWPGVARGLEAQGVAVLRHADARGALALPGGLTLAAEGLDEALRERLPAALFGAPLRLRLAAEPEPGLSWSREGDALRVAAHTALDAQPGAAPALHAELEGELLLAPDAPRVARFELRRLEARLAAPWAPPGARVERVELALRAQGSPEAWQGELDFAGEALREAESQAARLAVRGKAALSGDAGSLRIALPECAELSLSQARFAAVELAAPAALCLTTPSAPLVLSLAQPVRADFDARLALAHPLRLRRTRRAGGAPLASLAGLEGQLSGTAEPGGLAARLEWTARAPRAPSIGGSAASLAGAVDVGVADGARRLDGRLRAQGLRFDLRDGRQIHAPLTADATFRLEQGALRFELDARQGKRVRVRGSGRHELASRRGELALALAPLRFGADGVAPLELLPLLAGHVEQAEGSLSAKARLAWPQGSLGSLEVQLDGLGLRGKDFAMSGLSGNLRFDALRPFRSAPRQALSFARLASGIELASGGVTFTLAGDGRVEIHAAEGLFAGGWVRARGSVDPREAEHRFALELDGVPLGPLTRLAEIEGLSASGRLLGEVPIRVSGGRVFIDGARLEADPVGGEIRYRPAVPPPALSSAGAGGALALDALRDFRFEALGAQLRGDAEEAIDAEVYLFGANPAVAGGRSIELTLRFHGPGGAGLRDALAGIWFPQRFVPLLRGLRPAEGR